MTEERYSVRIPPLDPASRSEEALEMIASYTYDKRDYESNLFATMARHPKLVRRWMSFNSAMLVKGTLPAREREIVILRTAWLCRAEYEWGHHQRFGALAGLTEDEIRSIAFGPTQAGWNESELLVLSATNELHATAIISDATWEGLVKFFDERQLIELCMLAGSYHVAAFSVNSLGIQLEPDVPVFPTARPID